MKLHETCTTDQADPQFDHPWQRRAFKLAVALADDCDHAPTTNHRNGDDHDDAAR